MAYSCVKVIFEIGHEATVRTKKTNEGYTHDWELFIRGADNTDIHHFVDKVVFHLHETFPNPRRVVKEPPYSIRESGYAGFPLPVDVYLKNKPPAEPNKIRFNYHLTLQEIADAQPLSNVNKETHIFPNPTEDFRRKLIRGGGVGVGGANSTSSSHSSHMAALNSSHSADDHKTSGSKGRPSPQDVSKKSKKESSSKHEERLNQNDPFAIFGDPIIKKEIPYTTTSKSNSKPISDKVSQPLEKRAHSSSKSSKYNSSSHKDKDRDKDKEKEREKDKLKEREKDKEKSNNLKKNKDEPPLRKEKLKDDKDKVLKSSKEDTKMKNLYHDDKVSKEKEKEKSVEKFDKELKIDKKDREKKHKDEKKLKSKEKHKNDKKENICVHENYAERNEKPVLTKEDVTPVAKEDKKAHKVMNDEKEEKSSKDKSLYSNGTLSANSQPVVSAFDNVKKDDKHKHHKHKEKKSKKEGKREKEEKKEKVKEAKEPKEKTPVHVEPPPPKSTPKQTESPRRASKRPLKTLFDELTDKSDSDSSSDDDMSAPSTIREPAPDSPGSPPPQLQQSVSKADTLIYTRQQEEQSKDDSSVNKRKKKKTTEEKETNKRNKRKSKHREDEDEPMAKMVKYDDHHGPDDGMKRNLTPTLDDVPHSRENSESPIPLSKFTEEYISKLKELQRKIMSLDDNSGLQRIVQVVAETGQYEITTKTFDFDLCSLDEKIVQRLLDQFGS